MTRTARLIDPALALLAGAAALRDPSAPSPHAGRALHRRTGTGNNAERARRQRGGKLLGTGRDRRGGTQEPARIPRSLASLERDSGDRTNLAERRRGVAARFRALHEAHLAQT